MDSNTFVQLTPKEIADAHVPPHGLPPEEKAASDEALRKLRLERLSSATEAQRMMANLARLRFQMEDFLHTEGDQAGGFADFLQQYAQVLGRKQAVLADEISLHPTKLNQILRGKTNPNIALFYRLEKHSGGQIPAVLWWKVFAKKLEHKIGLDSEVRQREAARVKSVLQAA